MRPIGAFTGELRVSTATPARRRVHDHFTSCSSVNCSGSSSGTEVPVPIGILGQGAQRAHHGVAQALLAGQGPGCQGLAQCAFLVFEAKHRCEESESEQRPPKIGMLCVHMCATFMFTHIHIYMYKTEVLYIYIDIHMIQDCKLPPPSSTQINWAHFMLLGHLSDSTREMYQTASRFEMAVYAEALHHLSLLD